MLSGLLGTLPLIWENLSYWAQLLLLIVTTFFLFYAAGYSQKLDNQRLFIFKSNERVSSFLYLTSTVSFAAVVVFALNILGETTTFNLSEDLAILITSSTVLIYSSYLYKKTFEIFQHIALFYTLIFFLGSVGNLFLRNVEPWESSFSSDATFVANSLPPTISAPAFSASVKASPPANTAIVIVLPFPFGSETVVLIFSSAAFVSIP